MERWSVAAGTSTTPYQPPCPVPYRTAVRNTSQTAMAMRTGSMSRACAYSHALGTLVRRSRVEIALRTGSADSSN